MRVKKRLKGIRMSDYLMNPKKITRLINTNIKSYYSYEINFSRPTLEKALEIASKLNNTLYKIWYLK